jgi:hypothetical protein
MFERAGLLKLFADSRRAPYSLDNNERAAVREALLQVREGRLASESDVDAALRQTWTFEAA